MRRSSPGPAASPSSCPPGVRCWPCPRARSSSWTARPVRCTSTRIPTCVAEYDRRARELAERRARHLALASEPAVSRDGTHVVVAANLGSVADARSAFDAGADGSGLVRTEFLFLGRSSAPDIDEQEEEYAAISAALGGRRTTVRTLDVGGDKPLPYLEVPREANPFLGLRGLRLGPRPPRPPPRPAGRALPGRPPGSPRRDVPDGLHRAASCSRHARSSPRPPVGTAYPRDCGSG